MWTHFNVSNWCSYPLKALVVRKLFFLVSFLIQLCLQIVPLSKKLHNGATVLVFHGKWCRELLFFVLVFIPPKVIERSTRYHTFTRTFCKLIRSRSSRRAPGCCWLTWKVCLHMSVCLSVLRPSELFITTIISLLLRTINVLHIC